METTPIDRPASSYRLVADGRSAGTPTTAGCAAARGTPYWRLWGAIFTYAAATALLVQLVLLPRVFPSWHAGHGLLVGSDSLTFQQIASDLAQRIHGQGWSAWELRPAGQAPSGIAAAIYALIVPEPWTLVALNAALHATAGIILLRIVQVFLPDWRRAVWAVLPFVLYPTALTWYGQLHKDGYFILGALAFLYGWLHLARRQTWEAGWREPVAAALWLLAGAALVGLVRQYGVQMLQGVGIALALIVTGVFLARGLRDSLPWSSAVAGPALAWLVLLGITPLGHGGVVGSIEPVWASVGAAAPSHEASAPQSLAAPPAQPPPEPQAPAVSDDAPPAAPARAWEPLPWYRSPWLPAFLDDRLATLAVARYSFQISYPGAATNVDTDVYLQSAGAMLAYLPRAAQIAFLAPFPSQWLDPEVRGASAAMRRLAAVEMLGIYLALALLPCAIWLWRRRVELWLVLVLCGGMLLLDGLVLTNAGAIHRARYGFMMTLVALGIAGGLALWERYGGPPMLARHVHRVPGD